MTRALVALCLATLAAAAVGQVGSDSRRCDRLFAREARDYPDAAEIARIMDRWLVTSYPTRARFDRVRAEAIKEKSACLEQARARVTTLEEERRAYEGTLDFYRGRSLPVAVQAYIDAEAAQRVAAKEHERQQEADLARIHEIYDAQLKRLQSRSDWR